ncbi:PREDICTED: RNA-binding protein 40-like [Nicrophorus vespilloides]|uniref:RNA-binding protein 40-like n=1 Tax=Nicrophorus vespilloides TaxID=110193 RepID=A0ABM1N3U8_NICVS|nr:PREDICTED: RNA-binding protein 40-like [Nicrophorus vespilloides]
MVCEDTLKVKNLPKSLTNDEKEDFLRFFGATYTKLITSKLKEKTVAFAKFETKQLAKSVLHRLHQSKVLDTILYVEYAQHDIGYSKLQLKSDKSDDVKNKKFYKAFITKINAFNSSVAFNQPPPPYLQYEYPKANRSTINNIAHALASVPKFYTQVLHLMNKMNLPPPFSVDIADLPIREQPQPKQQQHVNVKESSSESEIESEPDEKRSKDIVVKRTLRQKKAIKRPKFIKPNVIQAGTLHKEQNADQVFDKVNIINRRIELKVNSECLDSKIESNGPDSSTVTEMEIAEDEEPKGTFISDKELSANRIPLKDLTVLPVFKDYHPGVPSCRLYIKNIAKSVEQSDLEYIYGKYNVAGDSTESSNFDIRLMQEGRMKGQAFVTFRSIEMAQKALVNSNGFILKDKPLVVVYGKTITK